MKNIDVTLQTPNSHKQTSELISEWVEKSRKNISTWIRLNPEFISGIPLRAITMPNWKALTQNIFGFGNAKTASVTLSPILRIYNEA